MKPFTAVITVVSLAATLAAASPTTTEVYTGVISESMCGINHTSMGISPDPKCITECVKHGQGVRYVLIAEKSGRMYTLSDQQTPERFAARRVRIKGIYYPKTKILKVDAIEAARSITAVGGEPQTVGGTGLQAAAVSRRAWARGLSRWR
jgi:hypothetical protein